MNLTILLYIALASLICVHSRILQTEAEYMEVIKDSKANALLIWGEKPGTLRPKVRAAWDVFAAEYSDRLVIAEIYCNGDELLTVGLSDFCKRQGIARYPTITPFKAGEFTPYKGGVVDANDFKTFADTYLLGRKASDEL